MSDHPFLYDVELRIRALRGEGVIEFTRRVELPFVPTAWMTLYEGRVNGRDEMQVLEVSWSMAEGRFVCRLMDDVDAQNSYGDNADAIIASYLARGWALLQGTHHLGVYEEPA